MSKPLNTVFLVDKTKDSGNGHYERCKSLEKIFQNKKGIKYIFNNFRNFTLNSLETENCIIDSYKINYSLEETEKIKLQVYLILICIFFH